MRFVGIANLRVKECDRVAAMATELSPLSLGLAVEDGGDLVVTPRHADSFRPAQIETYSDHRIAMSMALAGSRVPDVTILDPSCVRKTYPNYWTDVSSLGVDFACEASRSNLPYEHCTANRSFGVADGLTVYPCPFHVTTRSSVGGAASRLGRCRDPQPRRQL
ncbi:hypothetical protein K7957_09785 [Sphingomonas yunnanensis]|nr:hypothetical protein [Sphingomonas yunnanensis]